MAGTLTITPIPRKTLYGAEVNKIQLDWTSDAAGAVTGSVDLYGYLIKVITVPGATTPTNLYDLTLVSPDGASADEFAGLLADRSSSNTEIKYMTASGSSVPILLNGTYTFTIANAGNAKNGTVYLYLVDEF